MAGETRGATRGAKRAFRNSAPANGSCRQAGRPHIVAWRAGRHQLPHSSHQHQHHLTSLHACIHAFTVDSPCRFLASKDTRPRRSAPLSGTAAQQASQGAPGWVSRQAGRQAACGKQGSGQAVAAVHLQTGCLAFNWQAAPLTDHLKALALQLGEQALKADAAPRQHAGLHGAAHQGRTHHLQPADWKRSASSQSGSESSKSPFQHCCGSCSAGRLAPSQLKKALASRQGRPTTRLQQAGVGVEAVHGLAVHLLRDDCVPPAQPEQAKGHTGGRQSQEA